MPSTTRIKVRFGDVDQAGLVYFPTILHYCHVAMEDFFRAACGVEYHQMLAEKRLGFPTVNIQTEFFVPLIYGDEADIEVRVLRLGQSSLMLGYTVRRVSDGTVCCVARNVHVAMDLDARHSRPIPDEYRAKLEYQLALDQTNR